MPICGIEVECPIKSFDQYRQTVPQLKWSTPVDTNSGEYLYGPIKYDRKGRYSYRTIVHFSIYRGLQLKIKEVQKSYTDFCDSAFEYDYVLIINGSLHVSYHGQNSGSFNHFELRNQVFDMERSLKISPELCVLRNVEIGLNMELEHSSPTVVLSDILVYGNNTLIPYDNRAGYYREQTEYAIKVYDKGLLSRSGRATLRFELHFYKMRRVNRFGIRTLADLLKPEAVIPLDALLIGSWKRLLFFDHSLLKSPSMPRRDQEFLRLAQFGQYWERLPQLIQRNAVKKQRDKLNKIILAHGISHQIILLTLLQKTWSKLFSIQDTKSLNNSLQMRLRDNVSPKAA